MFVKGVDWEYFAKFKGLTDKYLPSQGEGTTMATQLVTAVNMLIYKWYNDGDVFDNTYMLDSWCNDLSSYANWLDKHYLVARITLERIKSISTGEEYEQLLKSLADDLFIERFLEEENTKQASGSIYKCEGTYEFSEYGEDDD
jgi:hypothetical protein